MNRNTKHPDRPYKRKPNTGDRTRGGRTWRITASWDARPDRPAVRTTTDRKARDRMVAEFVDQGGYVIVEEARGAEWRTVREVDGPALLAARLRAARDQAAAEQREQRHRADYEQQAARNTLAAALDAMVEHDTMARLMRRPPIDLAATGQATARHITGAQR
ncbi:hypothetical protein [Streptomyces sp. ML-6]|uniref:hypothetical protein n=1 Tax=Streptomyces sp. ML-6 TaxID=2982693 RepID=UPI0024C0771F|nr:hypothetical protein [Streptomyces sp. ML-6]MDK0520360.1 hypothetical protein [Streptomyces sp. ML-6]